MGIMLHVHLGNLITTISLLKTQCVPYNKIHE